MPRMFIFGLGYTAARIARRLDWGWFAGVPASHAVEFPPRLGQSEAIWLHMTFHHLTHRRFAH